MRRAPWIASAVLLGCLTAAAYEPPLGLDAYLPAPAGNPLTAEKVRLGRKLFFDKALSRDRSLSCATCHVPELGFTDEEPVAVGIGGQTGSRRTPRLINRGYGRLFFWDGRAGSLEEQVLKPIQNPIEMDLTLEEAVARLRSDERLRADFRKAFGAPPDSDSLAKALAAYVRTIVSGNSPYDRYIAGDRTALSASQRRGLELFRGKAACTVCHLGPNLTDEEFHNTGVGWAEGTPEDLGRYRVTGDPADRGAFKTPTLREVALAGPYMHDGSLETLEDVVEFYDKGGEENPYLDIDMTPLDLADQEKADLVEFLHALSGEIREGVL